MDQFSILHQDDHFLVCLKPARVRSTDEPGGMPELCRNALGNPKADVRTVHRLDQVVSGLMVLARGTKLSIFDEPEAGIDLWSFAGLIEAFQKLKTKNSGSILIISHQERILNIADEIIVIADGKVKARGSRQEIMPTLLADEKAAHCPRGNEVY